MRPEVAAFRELDSLVRKLTDQLAGYRRRAMAAEAKVRELEGSLDRAVEKGEAALAAALAAARAETTSVRRAFDEGGDAPDKQPDGNTVDSGRADRTASELLDSSDLSTYGDIALENERLRARLGEARVRTSLLVDRVRFLRQQLSQGAER
ncbi:MAG: hypothetical protein ABIW79_01545 [Gemmatimonas sp.]